MVDDEEGFLGDRIEIEVSKEVGMEGFLGLEKGLEGFEIVISD